MTDTERYQQIYSGYKPSNPADPDAVDRFFEAGLNLGLRPHIAGGIAIALGVRSQHFSTNPLGASEMAHDEIEKTASYVAENYKKLAQVIEPNQIRINIGLCRGTSRLRNDYLSGMKTSYNRVLAEGRKA